MELIGTLDVAGDEAIVERAAVDFLDGVKGHAARAVDAAADQRAGAQVRCDPAPRACEVEDIPIGAADELVVAVIPGTEADLVHVGADAAVGLAAAVDGVVAVAAVHDAAGPAAGDDIVELVAEQRARAAALAVVAVDLGQVLDVGGQGAAAVEHLDLVDAAGVDDDILFLRVVSVVPQPAVERIAGERAPAGSVLLAEVLPIAAARPAVEQVVAVAAAQRVGAAGAHEAVVAAEAADRVAAGRAAQRVVAGRAIQYQPRGAAVRDRDVRDGDGRRALQRGDELRGA